MEKKENTDKYPELNVACTSCGRCTAHCDFLKKYSLDFNKKEELYHLAYHCFLCGKCNEVCPVGVDGRSFMIELRQQRVREQQGKLSDYSLVQLEKNNYIFKNYRHGKTKSVLFPGCNYPSYYPETTKLLTTLLREHDIETVFDCCGKPVSELGLEAKEEKLLARLDAHLKEHSIEELVLVCPNCYYYLKDRLDVRMISIYEKLSQLGIGKKLEETSLKMFFPCPDREAKEWLQWMKDYLPEDIKPLTGPQCCGAGGCASKKEPELAAGFIETAKTKDPFYVYCGTCAGTFFQQRNVEVYHVLTEILKSSERPDVKKSLINRMKNKFR